MFEINPFAELAVTVPAGIMQGFVTVILFIKAVQNISFSDGLVKKG